MKRAMLQPTVRVVIAVWSTLLLFLFCHQATAAVPQLEIPPADRILSPLRQGHPRLLLTASQFSQLKQRLRQDPQLAKWHRELLGDARRVLQQAPSKYEIPDGLRLLSVSRRVLQRTYLLAWAYRIEGDPQYRERLWRELEAAARFKDWNPRHFLDTAEMTHAFAIGYDWLYDAWTPAQREVLRTAMVEKGIKQALPIHERQTWWTRARHNWNQVCNGGVGMGALALADVEPELAASFLHSALKSIQLPMAEYGPDGAWAEGPGYWNYATSYNVVFLAALESALGTDFGLSAIPGFSQAGLFPIYATGPLDITFNYADAHAGTIRAPAMFWLARKFNQPAFAEYEVAHAVPVPLDLIWYQPAKGAIERLPLDKHFRNAEVVTLRGRWHDRKATYVAMEAGDNKANHSHLDLGTFVLDALGQRWAVDLGSDNYNLPAYFGRNRWTYYRLRAEGHNTVVINPDSGPDQDPRAAARITRFESAPSRAFAIADLTPAYAQHANRVERGVALLERREVLLQDEIACKAPSELWWFVHTPASVALARDRRSATLSLKGERLEARLLVPTDARFEVRPAVPLPTSPNPKGQRENKGISKLTVHLPNARNATIAVWFRPVDGRSTSETPPVLSALSQW